MLHEWIRNKPWYTNTPKTCDRCKKPSWTSYCDRLIKDHYIAGYGSNYDGSVFYYNDETIPRYNALCQECLDLLVDTGVLYEKEEERLSFSFN